jgi:hypothetical protein
VVSFVNKNSRHAAAGARRYNLAPWLSVGEAPATLPETGFRPVAMSMYKENSCGARMKNLPCGRIDGQTDS